MERTLQNLRIRKVLMIYCICFILPWLLESIFVSWASRDFVRSLLFLLWFLLICKRNRAKISEIKYSFATIKWKQTIEYFVVLSCFKIGTLCILFYFFYDNANEDYESMDCAWYYLYVNITGPIVEEIIFRGAILNRLSKKIGVNKAIIVSSLMFAILHERL